MSNSKTETEQVKAQNNDTRSYKTSDREQSTNRNDQTDTYHNSERGQTDLQKNDGYTARSKFSDPWEEDDRRRRNERLDRWEREDRQARNERLDRWDREDRQARNDHHDKWDRENRIERSGGDTYLSREKSRGYRDYDQDSDENNKRNWRNIENSYRNKYPSLTDEDVDHTQGNYTDLTDRIGQKTNRSGREVRDEISNWDEANNQKITKKTK